MKDPRSSTDETTTRLDPTDLVFLTSIVTFAGLLRLSERYLPAYLDAIGIGPVVVGLLGTVALALSVGSEGVRAATVTERRENPPDASASAHGESTAIDHPGSTVVALTAASAAGGLLVWTGAPTLDRLLGTPLTAVGWLLLGVALCQPWHGLGPGTVFALGDHGLSLGIVSVPTGQRSRGDRILFVAAALGVASTAAFATIGFALTTVVPAGFALVALAGAAVGSTASVVLVVCGGTERFVGYGRTPTDTVADVVPSPPVGDAHSSDESVPGDRRRLVVGDSLVRFGTMVAVVYLVLLVVDYRVVGLSIGPLSLSPVATFGLFVLAETLGAIGGTTVASTLQTAVDGSSLLLGGFVLVALVPIAFLIIPASPLAFAALFALFGARTALEPVRPTGGSSLPIDRKWSSLRSGWNGPGNLSTIAHAVLVPAPVLGGLLYAVDPRLPFTVATTLGLLGVGYVLRMWRWH